MTMLLVTGAGASRNLGIDENPMPLMSDWSDALCQALDEREANLAAACELVPGSDGPTFEENLGHLLRWQQVRYLEKRFRGLGGDSAGSHWGEIDRARENTDGRMKVVIETINQTLYDQFGHHRIDDSLATDTFIRLFDLIGRPDDLILATTNYDRAGETALGSLGYDIDSGFRWKPHRTPILEPEGLVSHRGAKTPVIHLHGAVGWYKQNGIVAEHPADKPFNPSLGTPVVLYPDPDKDLTTDAMVAALWTEFEAALDFADSVFVLGHSLHDPKLVQELHRVANIKPIVISYLDGSAEAVTSKVPNATPVEVFIGPKEIRSSIPKGKMHQLLDVSAVKS